MSTPKGVVDLYSADSVEPALTHTLQQTLANNHIFRYGDYNLDEDPADRLSTMKKENERITGMIFFLEKDDVDDSYESWYADGSWRAEFALPCLLVGPVNRRPRNLSSDASNLWPLQYFPLPNDMFRSSTSPLKERVHGVAMEIVQALAALMRRHLSLRSIVANAISLIRPPGLPTASSSSGGSGSGSAKFTVDTKRSDSDLGEWVDITDPAWVSSSVPFIGSTLPDILLTRKFHFFVASSVRTTADATAYIPKLMKRMQTESSAAGDKDTSVLLGAIITYPATAVHPATSVQYDAAFPIRTIQLDNYNTGRMSLQKCLDNAATSATFTTAVLSLCSQWCQCDYTATLKPIPQSAEVVVTALMQSPLGRAIVHAQTVSVGKGLSHVGAPLGEKKTVAAIYPIGSCFNPVTTQSVIDTQKAVLAKTELALVELKHVNARAKTDMDASQSKLDVKVGMKRLFGPARDAEQAALDESAAAYEDTSHAILYAEMTIQPDVNATIAEFQQTFNMPAQFNTTTDLGLGESTIAVVLIPSLQQDATEKKKLQSIIISLAHVASQATPYRRVIDDFALRPTAIGGSDGYDTLFTLPFLVGLEMDAAAADWYRACECDTNGNNQELLQHPKIDTQSRTTLSKITAHLSSSSSSSFSSSPAPPTPAQVTLQQFTRFVRGHRAPREVVEKVLAQLIAIAPDGIDHYTFSGRAQPTHMHTMRHALQLSVQGKLPRELQAAYRSSFQREFDNSEKAQRHYKQWEGKYQRKHEQARKTAREHLQRLIEASSY